MLLHAATKKSPPLISITSLPGLGKPGGQQEHDANLPRPSRQDGGKRKLSLSASHSAVSCPPALKRPSLGIAASQRGKTPKRKTFLPEPRYVQRTSLDRTPGRWGPGTGCCSLTHARHAQREEAVVRQFPSSGKSPNPLFRPLDPTRRNRPRRDQSMESERN